MLLNYLDNVYNIIAVEADNSNYISDSLKHIIKFNNYKLTKSNNLDKVLTILKKQQCDIIAIDSSIIEIDQLETLRKIQNFDEDLYIIVVIDTDNPSNKITIQELQDMSIQGYCEKNDKLAQLPLFIKTAIKYIDQMRTITNINNELLKSQQQIESAYLESIETLRLTVEAKDTYTRGHSDRVAAYSVLIGQKLGLSAEELRTLRIGGMFHDIGKIGIPDSILLKEGKLTKEEYDEIKKHPTIGKDILSNGSIFKEIIPIVLYHHERYDGTGYPYGLTEKDIPFLARIVSVADAFDAMTTKRSYRSDLDISYVKNEIKTKMGTQFDPIVATTFLEIINSEFHLIKEIQNNY